MHRAFNLCAFEEVLSKEICVAQFRNGHRSRVRWCAPRCDPGVPPSSSQG